MTPSSNLDRHRREEERAEGEGDGGGDAVTVDIGRLLRWRAAFLFKEAGEREAPVTTGLPVPPSGGYGIGLEQLTAMMRDHNFSVLQEYGGVNGLGNMLRTTLDKGITGDYADIVCRRNAFGTNTYPRKKISFWNFLWEVWQELPLIILMIGAAISLVLGIKTKGLKEGWYDGGSIAFAVILVTLVQAIKYHWESLQLQNLNEQKQKIRLEVTRGGKRIEVSTFDLVVGDIVPLKIGDNVPADGILISGHSLAIDESSMTGEIQMAHKDQKAPFLMSGCKVADGYGTMLVTAVGMNTEWGILMAHISEDNGDETPLQVHANGVATHIGLVGLSVAGLFLFVLLVRYFMGHTKNPDGTAQFIKGHRSVKESFHGVVKILMAAVTVVHVAVPEGIPLAVNFTFVFSMRKMMRGKEALVRRLSACEMMGSATTICTDKTGTLTLNEMIIVEAYIGGEKIVPADNVDMLSSTASTLLIEGIAQNTTGNVFEPEDGGAIEVTGSPIEKAILSWGVKLGMRFEDARSKTSILHVFPFNSEKKRGGVAVDVGSSVVHIHWKGAAEIVLASCTGWLDANGSVKPMTSNQMDEFKKSIEVMAATSLRCLVFAYRLYDLEKVPSEEERLNWVLPEDDMILLGIVGIKDPCRPGVQDAIKLCTNAGVKVVMVTGDHLKTAKATALECGILGSEADATEPTLIEGRVFRALSVGKRELIAETISVMGRSSPSDKLLLVQTLRQRGHVVAVTGDGTNDAPALHEADIGLSMGIRGTEVAKESSDIIILDDNFASVVKVVQWGRSVYANIQKVVQFQLTVIVAAVAVNVIAAVISGEVPLNSVQLLWISLIIDTLGVLALATEPPTDQLMMRPPVDRREPLITNIMWGNLLRQAVYQVIVLLVLNFSGRSILHLKNDDPREADKVKNTVIFNIFVFCQVFNEFNVRRTDGVHLLSGLKKRQLFMGIIVLTVMLQVLIIEFLGKFFVTVRLTWKQWFVSVAIAFHTTKLETLVGLILFCLP